MTFLLLTGLYSCGNPNFNPNNLKIGVNITPIREIKPTQTQSATVSIEGKIEKQAPMIQRWAYQINDTTGKIWVLTKQDNLQLGQQVVLKGKVKYQSIPLGGKEYGEVYLEAE
ncbi:hypothetical protein VB711_11735 [Cronbergia sp. UHCC 0137]|uniref:hypothetical protein n=1 Tax=Cronbergia sp. UHCC 0137 TaxID=3110239 RepID=UPI002B1FCF97|nr:hypothetical protein [Cronbergia sp. UHCC 0137]MEA5618501.1 hypothetical protein [Cronbergia sp. UHCC 0137]